MTEKINITWRNHYIPQFILKNFLDFLINKIYVCDKSLGEEQEIIQRITNSTGYTEHLYTIEGEDGNPTDMLEKYLGTIETPASIIIEKIISHNNILINDNRTFRPLSLSQEELNKLSLFLAHQVVRTPKQFNLVAQTIHGMEHIISQFSEESPSLNAPKKTFSNDELVPFIFNEENIKQFIRIFNSYYFFLVINPEANFIIGDSGICSKFHFSDSQNEVYFPITPRISLMGIPNKFDDVVKLNKFFNRANKDNILCSEILKNINVCSIKDSSKLIFSNKPYNKDFIKEICSKKSSRLHISSGMGLMVPEVDRIARWKKNKF